MTRGQYRQTNTGFKGVSQRSSNNRYEARVSVTANGSRMNCYVGSYGTVQEAVEARKEFILKML